MNIEISVKEIDEMYDLVARRVGAFGTTRWYNGRESVMTGENVRSGAAFGWVSHPVADPAKQPPSEMKAATTENECGGGADFDIERLKSRRMVEDEADDPGHVIYMKLKESEECRKKAARAEDVGGSLLRRLLDFEAWTDVLCVRSDEVEFVRFHYDAHTVLSDKLFLYCVAHYKHAERRRVPREVIFRKAVDLSMYDDDGLGSLTDELYYDAVASVSGFLCADPEDYCSWLMHVVTPPETEGEK